MTADNSTTRLREALAREAWAPGWQADVILASLVEHRDDVLDVLGMERVGPISEEEWVSRTSQDEPLWGIAFRPKEQP